MLMVMQKAHFVVNPANAGSEYKSKIDTSMTNFGKKKTNFGSKASLKMYKEIASETMTIKNSVKSNSKERK